ncbi:MAG: hypothetical protein HY858_16195 [Candidatus Solibacter usitatus]|nr:hypothetical protein [Candidatus Solibacter usitatus]
MCAFLAFAWLSWFHSRELLATALGHTLLAWIALFRLLRAAGRLLFFGDRTARTWAFFAAFLLGALLYAWPWFMI